METKWCLRVPVFDTSAVPFCEMLIALGYAKWNMPTPLSQQEYERRLTELGNDGAYMLIDIALPPETNHERAQRIRDKIQYFGAIRIREWIPNQISEVEAPMFEHAPSLARAILFGIAQTHDGSDLWKHMKRDPDSFVRELLRILKRNGVAVDE